MFKFDRQPGAIALLVYSHRRFTIADAKFCEQKEANACGCGYPWLTWLVIGFITFVLVVMLFRRRNS
ncbi:MAG: hypothetical protein ACLRP3_03570 [Escherichia sp.]